MTLKSTKLITLKSTSQQKRKPVRDLLTGGITALLGVALLSQVAGVIRRI